MPPPAVEPPEPDVLPPVEPDVEPPMPPPSVVDEPEVLPVLPPAPEPASDPNDMPSRAESVLMLPLPFDDMVPPLPELPFLASSLRLQAPRTSAELTNSHAVD